MNKQQQPEALRLAEMLTAEEWPGNVTLVSYAQECVAELLHQHAENETVRAGYSAARLEIESLQSQLHAAKQINAAKFGLLAASIPGSAMRASRGQAPAQPDPAYSAACHLATALFKKHFAHLPDFESGQAAWSLCDSTAGVISQIDNMVSGLVQPPTTAFSEDEL